MDADLRLVLVDSAVWATWGVATGFAVSRLPLRAIDHDTWLTRLRPFERGGRCYERVGVRRWKDRLPDAGALFGGRSKRHLGGRTTTDLERFAAETRRAEIVHWLGLAAGPAFLLWNPIGLGAAMVAFAIVANVPFIVVQRSNRGRLARVLDRRASGVPSGHASRANKQSDGGGRRWGTLTIQPIDDDHEAKLGESLAASPPGRVGTRIWERFRSAGGVDIDLPDRSDQVRAPDLDG